MNKMWSRCLLFAVLSIMRIAADDETDAVPDIRPGTVHVLGATNFTSFIDGKFVLVKFYAPWCGHCKSLEKPYSDAAAKVADIESPIYFAKVDATVHTDLAKEFNIAGYPTLKFFRKSVQDVVDYNSGRSVDEMVSWLSKRVGPPTISLKSVEEQKKFQSDNPIVVYGYFKSDVADKEYDVYKNVAENFEEIKFAILDSDEILQEFGIDGDKYVALQVNGDRKVYDGSWNIKNLKRFLAVFSSPKIVDFNQNTAQLIFGNDITNHTLIFLSRKANDYDKLTEFDHVIDKYRGAFMFVSIDVDIDDHQRILEFLGVKADNCPAIRIVKFTDENMLKYQLLKNDFTGANLEESLQAFLEGKLDVALNSQEIPDDWDTTPVKVLVGKNFEQAIKSIKKPSEEGLKYMLVEFYAPWCGHCKQLEPIYNQLAELEEFKDNPKYWIAKMDATQNEVEMAKVHSFPTIRLYSRNEDGDLQQVEFKNERNLEGLKSFVLSGGEINQKTAKSSGDDEELPPKDEL